MENVTGWKVQPEDPVMLADALAAVLAQPERLSEVGQNARQFVLEKFSKEKFFENGDASFGIWQGRFKMPHVQQAESTT